MSDFGMPAASAFPGADFFRSGRRPRSGFTLLELLVVMALMSLMVGMVVPRMAGSLDRMNARTAARKVSAALRYARSQAAAEKVPFLVRFDFSRQTLSVSSFSTRGDSTEKIADASLTLPAGVRFVEARSAMGRKLDRKVFTVRFSPLGSSSGGDIVVGDDKGRRFRIVLDMLTGLNEIHGL